MPTGKKIRLRAGPVTATAELNESKTARAIWQALPFTASANTWGEEIYFAIPLKLAAENGREVVAAGDLGYWPTGNAFCIFFGPTPASLGEEIRAASAVNIFGKLLDDPKQFRMVKDGESITIEKA